MGNKEKYRKLCSGEPTIPIFSRNWWLDAVCGADNWDVVFAEEGNALAALPYFVQRRFGLILLRQPPLTQTLGPWFSGIHGDHAKNLSRQKSLMNKLIEKLPKFDHFFQCWHHKNTNWLPFYWKGFTQTTRYTYLINLSPSYKVLDGFTSNMRNKVRKAQKIVHIREDLPLNQFYAMYQKTYQRQGLPTPCTFGFLSRLDAAVSERDSGKKFFALDREGNTHSVLYLIWDDETAYVHLVGEDPSLRNSGAGILLIKEALDFTIRMGLNRFDFVGSMRENIEIVRRSCGGVQTPYFEITKTPSLILKLRNCLTSFGRED